MPWKLKQHGGRWLCNWLTFGNRYLSCELRVSFVSTSVRSLTTCWLSILLLDATWRRFYPSDMLLRRSFQWCATPWIISTSSRQRSPFSSSRLAFPRKLWLKHLRCSLALLRRAEKNVNSLFLADTPLRCHYNTSVRFSRTSGELGSNWLMPVWRWDGLKRVTNDFFSSSFSPP